MTRVEQTKSAPQQINLSVKPATKQSQTFVTPGMMYNKA